MKKYLILLAFLVGPQSSFAVQKIYSPEVDDGELTVEIGSQYNEQADDNNLQYLDNYKDVQTDLRYGFTDSLAAGFELNANDGNNVNEDFSYRITGFEGIMQFAEKDDEGKGLASGFRAEYELNHSGSDRVNAALLFDYVGESFGYMINAGIYSDVNGDNANDKDLVGDIRVGMRYLLSDMFQPGVEYYSDTGELDEMNGFEDQTQSLGPVVYGALTNNFYYEAGYLYGLTDTAADNSYKVNFGYKVDLDY